MRYIVVDVETGGLDPNRHSLLEVGAVVWDNGEIIGQPFCVPIIHETYVVTAKALEINGIDLATWGLEDGKTEVEAADAFRAWVDSYFSRDDRPRLAGWNVQFDERFLRKMCKPFWSYRLFDVQAAAEYLVARGAIPNLEGSAQVWAHFGIQRKAGRGGKNAHTADEDAIQTAKLLTAITRYPIPA